MKKSSYDREEVLRKLAAMKDEDIDFSDIPEITDFSKFRPAHELFPDLFRPVKKQVTLRMDADVIAWFKAHSPKYQTAMNAALREFIAKQKR